MLHTPPTRRANTLTTSPSLLPSQQQCALPLAPGDPEQMKAEASTRDAAAALAIAAGGDAAAANAAANAVAAAAAAASDSGPTRLHVVRALRTLVHTANPAAARARGDTSSSSSGGRGRKDSKSSKSSNRWDALVTEAAALCLGALCWNDPSDDVKNSCRRVRLLCCLCGATT